VEVSSGLCLAPLEGCSEEEGVDCSPVLPLPNPPSRLATPSSVEGTVEAWGSRLVAVVGSSEEPAVLEEVCLEEPAAVQDCSGKLLNLLLEQGFLVPEVAG